VDISAPAEVEFDGGFGTTTADTCAPDAGRLLPVRVDAVLAVDACVLGSWITLSGRSRNLRSSSFLKAAPDAKIAGIKSGLKTQMSSCCQASELNILQRMARSSQSEANQYLEHELGE
jgi:hypothetical protein